MADDVFCDDFLNGIIFIGSTNNAHAEICPDAKLFLESMGTVCFEPILAGESPKVGTLQTFLLHFQAFVDL